MVEAEDTGLGLALAAALAFRMRAQCDETRKPPSSPAQAAPNASRSRSARHATTAILVPDVDAHSDSEMVVSDNVERPPHNVQEHPRIAREAWPNTDLETRTSSV
ncbi:hypothetical protein L226DRAFT_576409 [Lentinus tigrinus ALCF2SS1-7]|uniref:uncharacterized protein n=1 Tax=Lentinus tigrinus ALCF2SS1-7 TaxID=1328758 RepID=UPI001165DDFE|nr:hypothetical protein L226DRAFT_576409 [Lentinus tigrinus ALCF2SS1-7]